LLLLAAVFAMHGPSPAAADTTPPVTAALSPVSAQLPAMSGPGADAHALAAAGAGEHVRPAAWSASGGAHAADAGSPAGHSAGHDSMLHALALCLAVLVAGMGTVLAALAVWLARRRLTGVAACLRAAVTVVADRATFWARGLELSRLCVLRI
jgi:hypothetical protein